MNKALYILKSVILCICIGIIIGFFAMVGVWALSEDKPSPSECLNILRIVSAAGAVAAAVIRLIYTLIDSRPVNKALKLSEQGNDPEKAYSLLKNKISRTGDPSKKNAYMLILSAVYTEAETYDEALETLEGIAFTELSQSLQQEYFNAFMYTYLLKGDIKNAEKVYKEAEPYFASPAPSVLHTLGVYEYAGGNYGKARSYLLQSKSADSSDRNVCDCDLYLALCSLKEGRADDAKALADEAEETLVTSTEEKNLAKLRAVIEKYEAPAPQDENETEENKDNEENERTAADD